MCGKLEKTAFHDFFRFLSLKTAYFITLDNLGRLGVYQWTIKSLKRKWERIGSHASCQVSALPFSAQYPFF